MVTTPAALRSGIAVHYARYLGANVMVTAAGFVSFPIMTRLLDNRQFGILGYYEAWLLVIAGVLKLGTQHAILRFYPHAGDRAALLRFRSDHVVLPFMLSCALWLLCVGGLALFAGSVPPGERIVLWLMAVMVPLTIWSSFVEAIMYALERSDISLWLKSIWRWSELVLVLATLYAIERSAVGVFGARLAVLVIVTLWLTRWFAGWLRGAWLRPRRAPALAGLAFGLPMMANELVTLVFGFADRILLRALTGDFAQVGIYTIGFGLAMAVGAVFGQTLNQAFTPTAVRLYETRGAAAVVDLKRDMLDVWLLAVAIASALLLAVGQDLFLLLAGPDKAASAPVFVAIALTMVWHSLFGIAQYGLLLQKRALPFMMTTLYATLLNIGLNVPLILEYGVMGAVAATVLSHLFMWALQCWRCPTELRYLPSAARFAVALAFVLVAWQLFELAARQLQPFGIDGHVERLFAGSALVLLCALPMIALDRELHRRVRHMLQLRREAGGEA